MTKTAVVGTNNRNGLHRIWLEGADLLKMGLKPEQRYNLYIDMDGVIQGVFKDDGKRKVSGKLSAGVRVPVLDLNNKEIHALVEKFDIKAVKIEVGSNSFTISPTDVEQKRLARVGRFKNNIAAMAVTLGTIFSGGGIFDHAAHAGLIDSGYSVNSTFAVEINQQYASIASVNNSTMKVINSPIEQVANDLPQCDFFIAGVPCNGASISGISKNKLERPEQHEKVGSMAFWTLQAIQKSQPSTVLLENVPNYENTASADIIKSVLRTLGYKVSTRIISGSEVGALEDRKRWFLLAHTGDLDINEMHIENFGRGTVQDILQPIAEDRWRKDQPFKAKKLIDAKKGNGFSKNDPVTADMGKVNTIGAGYNKRRPSEPYLYDPKNGYRWFTAHEHALIKGVPPHLIANVAETTAHEILGQSGIYNIVYQLTQQIFKTNSKV